MKAILVTYVGLFGLIVGSFLTVVIHRVPTGASIVAPRSHCPSCGEQIRPIDNVPVISYLVRRGRCRSCNTKIPIRYLIIELSTGVLFAAVALRAASPWEIPAYCVLAATLVAVSAIDLELFRVPTRIVYTSALIGGALLTLASAGTHDWGALLRAVIAGAASLMLLLLIHAVVPRGMGLGDVRLAGLCGAFLGWLGYRFDVTGIWLSFVGGGTVAIALLAIGRVKRGARLPFAPFLAAGTLTAVLLGTLVAHLQLP